MVVERKFRVGSSAVLPTLLAGFSGNNNAKIGSRPLVFFFSFSKTQRAICLFFVQWIAGIRGDV
jgi:hypothetical protein